MYTSVRSGVTPFFYFRVDPEFFADAPISYFATFDDPEIAQLKSRIITVGSSAITFIDVGGVARQIQDIVARITQVLIVVSILFGISALLALRVLLLDYRSREQARFVQYKLLGARDDLLQTIQRTIRIVPIALSLF